MKPSMQSMQSELVLHEPDSVQCRQWALSIGCELESSARPETNCSELAFTGLLKTGGQGSGTLVDWGGQVSSSSSWPPGHTEKNLWTLQVKRKPWMVT